MRDRDGVTGIGTRCWGLTGRLEFFVRLTVGDTLGHLLNLEMSLFLGEADQADNKRNGFRVRDYTIKGIGTVRLNLPKDRKVWIAAITPSHDGQYETDKCGKTAIKYDDRTKEVTGWITQTIRPESMSLETFKTQLAAFLKAPR